MRFFKLDFIIIVNYSPLIPLIITSVLETDIASEFLNEHIESFLKAQRKKKKKCFSEEIHLLLAKGISASDRIELKVLIRQLAPEAHTVLFFSSTESSLGSPLRHSEERPLLSGEQESQLKFT